MPILLQAQGWEKFYGDSEYLSVKASKATDDGGLVMFGAQSIDGAPASIKRPFVIKLDVNGVVEWEYYDDVRTGTFVFPQDIVATSDGNYVLSFLYNNDQPDPNNVVVLNISPSGTLNWEYNFNDTPTYGVSKVIELDNGEFVVAGIFRDSAAINGLSLYQINATGNLVWEDQIVIDSSNISVYVSEVIQDGNGDIVLVGYQAFIGTPAQDIFIYKYDALGNLIYNQTYAKPGIEYPSEVLEDRDGGYLIGSFASEFGSSSYLSLLKVDSNGNELWYKQYDNIGTNSRINGLELGADNGLVISGTIESPANSFFDFYLQKLSADGELEWQKTYGRELEEINVSLHSDTLGYYLVGTSQRNGFELAYVVRTDVNGVSFSNELSGVVYNDESYTCELLPDEMSLQNWLVSATKGSDVFYSISDTNGAYSFLLDTGDYQIQTFPTSDYWGVCNNNFVVTFDSLNQTETENIGGQVIINCPLMDVSIGAPFLRRCFPNRYFVNYCNLGAALAKESYIEVTLDSFMTYINSSIPLSSQNGNVLTFELGDVEISQCGDFTIDVQLGDVSNNCEELPLGFTNCIQAHIFPDSLCNVLPSWSGASLDVGVVCTGDSVIFTITNVGTAPMAEASEYIVIEDDVILMIGTVILNPNEIQQFAYATNGATYRMEVAQEVDHPGFDMPSSSIENCGPDNANFSIGFVNIFSQNDANNFIDIDCQQNIGSYDPNDKIGYPLGYTDAHLITRGQELEYQIRFQNTGTDTAFNVVIRDTLSEFLDLSTVRPGISSHDYTYSVTPEGIITFRFENIQLPDSTVNLEGSNGFVRFKIAQVSNLPFGTEINNSAGIYFDFNSPIITNTTLHTIQEPFVTTVSIDELENKDWNVSAFPNPFDEYVNFRIDGLVTKKSIFNLYNINGQLIQSREFFGQQYEMEASKLTGGMYFFNIQSNGEIIATGKIIKQ